MSNDNNSAKQSKTSTPINQTGTSSPQASLGGQLISDLLANGPTPTMRPITEGFTLHEHSRPLYETDDGK